MRATVSPATSFAQPSFLPSWLWVILWVAFAPLFLLEQGIREIFDPQPDKGWTTGFLLCGILPIAADIYCYWWGGTLWLLTPHIVESLVLAAIIGLCYLINE